jgi:hypothetical protein
MQFDYFLSLKEIPSDYFKSQIQLMSWSWGASQVSSVSGTGGAGAGKADLSDFSLITYFEDRPWLLGHLLVVAGPHRKSSASIVFKNKVEGQASPPIHRVDIDQATLSDVKPCFPPGPRPGPAGLQMTLRFPEYRFNGIRNALIPLVLMPAKSVVEV